MKAHLTSCLGAAGAESSGGPEKTPPTSRMEPPFHAEFVGGVQGFIEADLLPGGTRFTVNVTV